MPSLAFEPSASGVTRSTSIKILGVTMGEKLSVSTHIEQILALRHFTPLKPFVIMTFQHKLYNIINATTMARLMYASPARRRFLSEDEFDRIYRFVCRAIRERFHPVRKPAQSLILHVISFSI